MKRHSYLSLSFFFCFLVINVFSQQLNYSTLLIPPALKENANATIRENAIEITILAVDRMLVKQKRVVTVFNKLGNGYASLEKQYDNDTKIKGLVAKVYNQFGKEIKKYSKRKFLDASVFDGFSLYSDARKKYIDYTPTEYPYTMVFESEYETSSTGFIPSWYPTSGYYVSVEKSSYQLNNPLKIPVRLKENNFVGFAIENSSSEFDLKYELQNFSAVEYERYAQYFIDFMPRLQVAINDFALKKVKGSASNWNEFGKWMYSNLLVGRDHLDLNTKIKIKALVKDVENPLDRAKIVYEFMQQKTRYISVQVGIGGWSPIPANIVDKVGYGDCKGLTNYTKALLDAADVTSYYTVVNADEQIDIDAEFASIQGNHVFLNIPNNGKDVWLECTSQTTPFGFLGRFTDDRDVLVITPEGGMMKHTPAYLNETNLQHTKAFIELDEKGNVKASLERISEGIQYDDKYLFETISDEDLIKKYKSDLWSYINNLEINSVHLKNDKQAVKFTETINTSITDYASLNQNEYLFKINVFNRINQVPKRYRNRKQPLEIDRGYLDIDEYTITIPTGYSMGVLPPEKEIKTEFGDYLVSIEKTDDQTIMYKRTILIKAGFHPKEKYSAYRKFRKKISKLENLRIALLKK